MKTFEELGVAAEILQAIQELGYESPMPVQEEVIPFLLGKMNDVIALAQTGTGKTAAFGIPIIQTIDIKQKQPQALILCPTRELCLQIAGDLQDYSKYVEKMRILPVYGGSSIESQINSLKKGVHVIVATPGRLIDLIGRKTVSLAQVKNVVLDEADEMLNMGFSESIDEILSQVPETRNTLLFSATMPAEIEKITHRYMRNPKEIVIGNKNEGNKNVKHQYYLVHAKDRYLALKRIADYYPDIYAIIFCRTRKETQEVAEQLIEDGYNADALHGELSQAQRDNVMQRFRLRNIQLLVATDVAARGLDVDDLTHVINYGLPAEVESYTHRSGRTGRAGKTGISISIVHVKEKGKIKEIEKIISKKFESCVVPKGSDICEKQLIHFVDKLEKVKVDEEQISPYLPLIFRKLEWLDHNDLIKRIVALEFNRLMDYYRHAADITIPDIKAERQKEKAEKARKTPEGYTRIFINLGKIDGLYPNILIDFINNNISSRVDIGKIDLMQNFSFFEVNDKDVRKILKAFHNCKYLGRKLIVEVAQDRPDEGAGNSRKSHAARHQRAINRRQKEHNERKRDTRKGEKREKRK